uniref:Uncharacterized protein n=1 Tax=Megaselia scalaris TaxID=36166 RepID=T1H0P1_MEGSC
MNLLHSPVKAAPAASSCVVSWKSFRMFLKTDDLEEWKSFSLVFFHQVYLLSNCGEREIIHPDLMDDFNFVIRKSASAVFFVELSGCI